MLDPYEEEAERRIEAWLTRSRTGVPGGAAVGRALGAATGKALELPGARNVVAKVDDVIKIGFAGAAKSISIPNVVAEYSLDGVEQLSDVRRLSLRRPDEAVASFGTAYAATAGAIGLAGGLAPLVPGVGTAAAVAALGVEVVAVTGLALRAVCDYAAHYGYDPGDPAEQAFMTGVVGATGVGTSAAERVALSRELITVSEMIAKRATWEQLRKKASVQVLEKAAAVAGRQLVKRQLAVLVPVVGGALSAAADTWFLSQIDDAARNLYGRRFLAEKKRSATG